MKAFDAPEEKNLLKTFVEKEKMSSSNTLNLHMSKILSAW